jgi:DNA processing protein
VAVAAAREPAAVSDAVDADGRGPGFWQRALAAELTAVRLEALGDDLPRGLSASEAARWERATLPLVAKAWFLPATDFPSSLAADARRPCAIGGIGDRSALDAPCVAIVGTRRASPYGRAVARGFAAELARAGVTVVSGGARGIDAAAHEGALDTDGRTVAVLPCGADVDYPSTHGPLLARVRAAGCTVSAYPLGATPQAHWTSARNRVIAALSSAVVAVEVPAESGALHTVVAADELGRQVFVVPGPVNQETFRGSHRLIREGATLVEEPREVLEALGLVGAERGPRRPQEGLAGAVLAALAGQPQTPEAIVRATGLEPAEVLAALTELELLGEVVRDAGGYALPL